MNNNNNTVYLAEDYSHPHNQLKFLLLVLFTVSSAYVATLCIYRLFLHPFAHIPGPLLAKLTDAYGLYHAWQQDTHLTIYRLHLEHGAIVRYGPNRILVNDVQGMKEIYGYSANFVKGKAYETLRITPVASVFNTTDKNAHRRKRRLVAQGFSEAALRESEGCVLKHVDRFVNILLDGDHKEGEGKNWGTSKDVSIHCKFEKSSYSPLNSNKLMSRIDSKLPGFGCYHRLGLWPVHRRPNQARS